MGRPAKKGLDYFPLDVNFWDDYKIMDLLDEHGPLGLCIYEAVLCEVYKHGYYLEIPIDKLASQVIRRIGNRWIKQKSLVQQVILFCADIGLFDHALLQQSVVTSAGIQQRYSEVTVRNKADKTNYWLLEKNEPQAALASTPSRGISVAETRVSATETGVNVPETPQSKVKERKEKESKVKCVLTLPCKNGDFVVDETFLTDLTQTHPDMDVMVSLKKLRDYWTANPHKRSYTGGAKSYVLMWVSEDDHNGKYRRSKSYAPGYDLSEYENSSVFDDLPEEEAEELKKIVAARLSGRPSEG